VSVSSEGVDRSISTEKELVVLVGAMLARLAQELRDDGTFWTLPRSHPSARWVGPPAG